MGADTSLSVPPSGSPYLTLPAVVAATSVFVLRFVPAVFLCVFVDVPMCASHP